MVERSMDIWSFDKLFIFIIFVVPGFIREGANKFLI